MQIVPFTPHCSVCLATPCNPIQYEEAILLKEQPFHRALAASIKDSFLHIVAAQKHYLRSQSIENAGAGICDIARTLLIILRVRERR